MLQAMGVNILKIMKMIFGMRVTIVVRKVLTQAEIRDAEDENIGNGRDIVVVLGAPVTHESEASVHVGMEVKEDDDPMMEGANVGSGEVTHSIGTDDVAWEACKKSSSHQ